MFLDNEDLYNLVRPDVENKLNLLKDKQLAPSTIQHHPRYIRYYANIGLC